MKLYPNSNGENKGNRVQMTGAALLGAFLVAVGATGCGKTQELGSTIADTIKELAGITEVQFFDTTLDIKFGDDTTQGHLQLEEVQTYIESINRAALTSLTNPTKNDNGITYEVSHNSNETTVSIPEEELVTKITYPKSLDELAQAPVTNLMPSDISVTHLNDSSFPAEPFIAISAGDGGLAGLYYDENFANLTTSNLEIILYTLSTELPKANDSN